MKKKYDKIFFKIEKVIKKSNENTREFINLIEFEEFQQQFYDLNQQNKKKIAALLSEIWVVVTIWYENLLKITKNYDNTKNSFDFIPSVDFINNTKNMCSISEKISFNIPLSFSNSISLSQLAIEFLSKVYVNFKKQITNKDKLSTGIVYTPFPIISFIIRFLNFNLKSRFDLSDGIKSDQIYLYDPAVGSLAFEMALLEFYPNNKLGNFMGNEINLAGYIIGRFILSDLIYIYSKEHNIEDVSFKIPIDFHNSLHPSTNEKFSKLQKEKPLIIFGNPPYSVSSSNKGDWIYSLMADYAVKEPNITRLYDDYVKFIRLAHYLIKEHGWGMIGFVTNRKFLDGKIFYGMRKTLLEEFDEIYIVDLHGDKRNKKNDYNGENVFEIQTGVAISFFIKYNRDNSKSTKKSPQTKNSDQKSKNEDKFGDLNYLSIKSSKNNIFNKLEQEITPETFEKLCPEPNLYLFIPVKISEKLHDLWEKHSIPIIECFTSISRAMLTSRDKFMINIDRNILKENVRLLKERNFAGLKELKRIRKPFDKILQNEELLSNFDLVEMKESIMPLTYRPFDLRYGINYVVNRKCGKSIILDHLEDKNYTNYNDLYMGNIGNDDDSKSLNKILEFSGMNFVHSMQKPPFSHIFVSYGLVDSGMFGYSTSKVAPLLVNNEWNLSADYSSLIRSIDPQAHEIDIFGYIYGLLNHPSYKELFENLLVHEFPRIIHPKNKELFRTISSLGVQLIKKHLFILNPDENKDFDNYCQTLQYKYKKLFPLSLKNWTFIKSDTKSKDPNHEIVDEKNGNGLLILSSQKFSNSIKILISHNIYSFMIGSIKVIDNWLKNRKFSKIQRPLIWNEFVSLLKIIKILDHSVTIRSQLGEISFV